MAVPQLPSVVAELRQGFPALLHALEEKRNHQHNAALLSHTYTLELLFTLVRVDVGLGADEKRLFVHAFDRVMDTSIARLRRTQALHTQLDELHHFLHGVMTRCAVLHEICSEKGDTAIPSLEPDGNAQLSGARHETLAQRVGRGNAPRWSTTPASEPSDTEQHDVGSCLCREECCMPGYRNSRSRSSSSTCSSDCTGNSTIGGSDGPMAQRGRKAIALPHVHLCHRAPQSVYAHHDKDDHTHATTHSDAAMHAMTMDSLKKSMRELQRTDLSQFVAQSGVDHRWMSLTPTTRPSSACTERDESLDGLPTTGLLAMHETLCPDTATACAVETGQTTAGVANVSAPSLCATPKHTEAGVWQSLQQAWQRSFDDFLCCARRRRKDSTRSNRDGGDEGSTTSSGTGDGAGGSADEAMLLRVLTHPSLYRSERQLPMSHIYQDKTAHMRDTAHATSVHANRRLAPQTNSALIPDATRLFEAILTGTSRVGRSSATSFMGLNEQRLGRLAACVQDALRLPGMNAAALQPCYWTTLPLNITALVDSVLASSCCPGEHAQGAHIKHHGSEHENRHMDDGLNETSERDDQGRRPARVLSRHRALPSRDALALLARLCPCLHNYHDEMRTVLAASVMMPLLRSQRSQPIVARSGVSSSAVADAANSASVSEPSGTAKSTTLDSALRAHTLPSNSAESTADAAHGRVINGVCADASGDVAKHTALAESERSDANVTGRANRVCTVAKSLLEHMTTCGEHAARLIRDAGEPVRAMDVVLHSVLSALLWNGEYGGEPCGRTSCGTAEPVASARETESNPTGQEEQAMASHRTHASESRDASCTKAHSAHTTDATEGHVETNRSGDDYNRPGEAVGRVSSVFAPHLLPHHRQLAHDVDQSMADHVCPHACAQTWCDVANEERASIGCVMPCAHTSLPGLMYVSLYRMSSTVHHARNAVTALMNQTRIEMALVIFRVLSTVLDWLIPAVQMTDRRAYLFYRTWVCEMYRVLHDHDLMSMFNDILDQSMGVAHGSCTSYGCSTNNRHNSHGAGTGGGGGGGGGSDHNNFTEASDEKSRAYTDDAARTNVCAKSALASTNSNGHCSSSSVSSVSSASSSSSCSASSAPASVTLTPSSFTSPTVAFSSLSSSRLLPGTPPLGASAKTSSRGGSYSASDGTSPRRQGVAYSAHPTPLASEKKAAHGAATVPSCTANSINHHTLADGVVGHVRRSAKSKSTAALPAAHTLAKRTNAQQQQHASMSIPLQLPPSAAQDKDRETKDVDGLLPRRGSTGKPRSSPLVHGSAAARAQKHTAAAAAAPATAPATSSKAAYASSCTTLWPRRRLSIRTAAEKILRAESATSVSVPAAVSSAAVATATAAVSETERKEDGDAMQQDGAGGTPEGPGTRARAESNTTTPFRGSRTNSGGGSNLGESMARNDLLKENNAEHRCARQRNESSIASCDCDCYSHCSAKAREDGNNHTEAQHKEQQDCNDVLLILPGCDVHLLLDRKRGAGAALGRACAVCRTGCHVAAGGEVARCCLVDKAMSCAATTDASNAALLLLRRCTILHVAPHGYLVTRMLAAGARGVGRGALDALMQNTRGVSRRDARNARTRATATAMVPPSASCSGMHKSDSPIFLHHHRFRYPQIQSAEDVLQLYMTTLAEAEGLLSPHDPLRARLVHLTADCLLDPKLCKGGIEKMWAKSTVGWIDEEACSLGGDSSTGDSNRMAARALVVIENYLADVAEEGVQLPTEAGSARIVSWNTAEEKDQFSELLMRLCEMQGMLRQQLGL